MKADIVLSKLHWEEKVIWHKYPEIIPPSSVKYYTVGIPDILGFYSIDSLQLKDFDKNQVECWCERLTTYSDEHWGIHYIEVSA